MSDIQTKVANIIAIAFVAALFLFAFTWIAFHHEGINSPVKEAFSVLVAILGVVATFTAAYIAVLLFNDWRIQFNKQIKDRYFVDILTLMRTDLIKFAPILSSLISTCDKYANQDIVGDLNISPDVLNELYSSHKTTALIFKEFHFATKDDATYLAYLKFYTLQEKLIPILIKISMLESKIEKLDELTTQLYYISFPVKLSNGRPEVFDTQEMLPINMCGIFEYYYLELVKFISTQKLAT